MGLVPEDASRQRKDFVRYALTSVGKIPYYWGANHQHLVIPEMASAH